VKIYFPIGNVITDSFADTFQTANEQFNVLKPRNKTHSK